MLQSVHSAVSAVTGPQPLALFDFVDEQAFRVGGDTGNLVVLHPLGHPHVSVRCTHIHRSAAGARSYPIDFLLVEVFRGARPHLGSNSLSPLGCALYSHAAR